jgi:hypothetical protein
LIEMRRKGLTCSAYRRKSCNARGRCKKRLLLLLPPPPPLKRRGEQRRNGCVLASKSLCIASACMLVQLTEGVCRGHDLLPRTHMELLHLT